MGDFVESFGSQKRNQLDLCPSVICLLYLLPYALMDILGRHSVGRINIDIANLCCPCLTWDLFRPKLFIFVKAYTCVDLGFGPGPKLAIN